MPKPNQPRKRSKAGPIWACIAVAMGVGAGLIVELDPEWLERAVAPAAVAPAPPPGPNAAPTATSKSARLTDLPSLAARGADPASTAALPPLPQPRTQPEARSWIVEQLDRDMQANPLRRETALNTCVLGERGKPDADWMSVRACYQRLIASSQPSR